MILPRNARALLCALVAAVSSLSGLAAETPATAPPQALRLPAVFTSNMVLQRGMKVPVWGWSRPGARVSVSIAGTRQNATADAKGKWMAKIGPLSAGGPHEMRIADEAATLTLDNVMVGEVWLASGQSNMDMTVAQSMDPDKELAAAGHPGIRLFAVRHSFQWLPQEDCQGRTPTWTECTSETVREFSAAAYFFGRDLHAHLGVPIGLINSSLGATAAEYWISADSLGQHRDYEFTVRTRLNNREDPERARQVYQRLFDSYDAGTGADGPRWAAAIEPFATWPKMKLPGNWENQGLERLDGVVWFKRFVPVPPEWKSKPLRLSLGTIDDDDTAWFNDSQIGSTRGPWTGRVYDIPAGAVRERDNVLTLRVIDTGGGGGLTGPPGSMHLAPKDDTATSIPLAGEWSCRIGMDCRTLWPCPPGPEFQMNVTGLYNGMIAPLVPFGIRGVIWYQGESNAQRAWQYRTIFRLLIDDWRDRWGQGAFPFLYVQLAGFMESKSEPSDDEWAELREAQLVTLGKPKTGMAVAIDIGDAHDIHPKNKQEVGRRLALQARGVAYGEKVVCNGPMYEAGSLSLTGGVAKVGFTHTDGGLRTADGAPPRGFAIAGSDRRFVWANARIDGDSVTLWSREVPRPVAVRYAWAANPVCNLCNGAGLPAPPFRTDRWPGLTEPPRHRRR